MELLKNKHALFFLILCIIIIIFYIPHYDIDSNMILFGQFYTTNEVEDFTKLISNSKSQINTLENDIENYIKRNLSLNNDNSILKTNIEHLNSEISQLKQSNQVLQYKIQQQHEYYEKKDKTEEKTKKEEFTRVSKKVINTSRPELGNMFSKSIKKKTNYEN